MRSADFYEWQRRANRHGTLWRALTEYYAESDHLYRVQVNGEDHALPVLTAESWLRPRSQLDSVLGAHHPTRGVESVDADAIQSRVNRLAYWNTDVDAADPDVDDYLWNGDVVQPLPARDEPHIETGQTTYFSALTQDARLVSELADGLYAADVPATASQATLAETVDRLTLAERDRVCPTFDDTVANLASGDVVAPFGVNVCTVFNTGTDYKLVVSKRSENVVVYPGVWSLVPAGGMELDETGTPSATWSALCEFGEELFAVPEDTTVTSHAAIQDLQALLETGAAHLDFTGVGIAARRLGVNITALLFIDDPGYYQTHIADGFEYNWETDDGEQVSITDADALAETLNPNQCVPAHVVAAYEGLLRLEEAYDVTPALDIERRPLRE